jgi:hypothetical protein
VSFDFSLAVLASPLVLTDNHFSVAQHLAVEIPTGAHNARTVLSSPGSSTAFGSYRLVQFRVKVPDGCFIGVTSQMRSDSTS